MARRRVRVGSVRIQDDTTLPPEFRDPAVMAYIATLLTWREGDSAPVMPKGVTKESLPGLLAKLDDPGTRRAVTRWLSKLLPSRP
jgi:hypothetical protein